MSRLIPADIARVTHEANRAFQVALGEEPSAPWSEADLELQTSAVDGVVNALAGAGPEESHENWLRFKRAHGWVYGEVKDTEAKTHPCLVEYPDLPPEQKTKDDLFTSVVRALAPLLEE